MATKVFEIDLDIKDPKFKLVSPIEVVSGDTDTNIFNIQLFENFAPVNASGNTVVIIFGKPDNTTVFQNLTVVDATKGQYTCTLSSQTIAVQGRIKAEIALYEGIKRLTSTRFEFNVRKAILDENTVESSNEFSALTEALNTVNQYDNKITENTNNIGPLASLITRIKTNIVNAINGLQEDHNTHLAENVTDADGVHGLKVESGTFTPTIYGTTASGNPTYNADYTYGQYKKIGNIVHVIFSVGITSKGGMEGSIRFSGLPFVPNGGGSALRNRTALTIIGSRGLTYPEGYTIPIVQIAGNANVLVLGFIGSNVNTGDNINISSIADNFYLTCSGTYQI